MAVAANKRSTMTLYADRFDINSHRVRMVLAEKGVPAEIIEVDPQKLPDELLKLNPYGTLPILLDRDLVLYEASIIVEYLDERFPHPPLLPVYPIARAKNRLMMLRIEREWYGLLKQIRFGTETEAKTAKKMLIDSLLSFSSIFASLPYFLSEEFSLVDCCVAPLLWLLPKLDVQLPPQAKAIHQYAERIFQRPSFKASLTATEREHEPA